MHKILKQIFSAVVVVALSASLAGAAEDAKPVKLRFSSQSAPSSLPFWFPSWVAFALATNLDNSNKARGFGGFERIGSSDSVDNLRVELGWALTGGSSAASSASSSAFGSIVPFFVLGAVLTSNSIRYLVPAGGPRVPANGTSDFRGIYAGLNVNLAGKAGRAAASSSAAILIWDVFFNAGWGKAEVDAFGGAFRRSDTGLFYEIGTSVQFDLGGVLFGPAIVHRRFDQSQVNREETLLELKFTIPLN